MVAKTVHDTFLLRDGRANAAMTKTRALEERLHAAALAAHPGWREITEPRVTVNGRTFAKIDNKAPATKTRLISWLKKHRPQEALRVATELGFTENDS